MQGWIKLHRKLVDWEWYTDIPVKTLFIHLLLLANHEPKQWRGQTIDRGACVTSISSLAQGCGLSEQQTRTALNKLLATHEINKQTTNKNTVVIVLNYSLYQGLIDNDVAENNKQITSTATNNQQAQQQTNNNKQEIKKIRNKEYKNITSTTNVGIREKFDWSCYSQEELTEKYPFSNYDLTVAEIDLLYKVVQNDALERYLAKISDYECKDRFSTIVGWATQDGYLLTK